MFSGKLEKAECFDLRSYNYAVLPVKSRNVQVFLTRHKVIYAWIALG